MSDEGASEGKKPRRGIAVLLCLVAPMGTGQFYLGQTKRAVAWLVGPMIALLLGALVLRSVGEVLGYGKVLALLVCALLLAWAASLVDVLLLPEARVASVRKLAVAGFVLAAYVSTFAVARVLRGNLIEAFKIPSGSMQPALLVGDHIMADKLAFRSYAPKRGEMIVFKSPEHPEQDFVKRVIAVPNDTLELKHGHPWLNGWEVPHCLVGTATLPDSEPGCSGTLEVEFLADEAYLVFFDGCHLSEGNQGPYVATPDEVWVLGDNRSNSFDSPSWFHGRGGGLPLDHVKGRGLFRWYSRAGWSRYGTSLRDPLLPDSMAALRPDLERCLAHRPAREKTLPPNTGTRSF